MMDTHEHLIPEEGSTVALVAHTYLILMAIRVQHWIEFGTLIWKYLLTIVLQTFVVGIQLN